MSDPRFTVAIATRDRPALLARCLEALAALDHPSYEVLVIDNTAGDPEVERLAAASGARYVVEPAPGLSRARNRGGREARGELVAFTDDDAIPDPRWLSEHERALSDPSLAATTGRVLPIEPDSPVNQAFFSAGGFDIGDASLRVDRTTEGWFELANFGGIGAGANLAFRQALFRERDVFAPDLGPGGGIAGEEHYAFFTLVRDGHAIAYVPEAIVHHDAAATFEDLAALRQRIANGSAAYIVRLLVEERGFRLATLRYALESLSGRRRQWRQIPAPATGSSRKERLAVAGAAPFRYFAYRLRVPADGCARGPSRRALVWLAHIARRTRLAGPAFRLREFLRSRTSGRLPTVGADGLPIPPARLQVLVAGRPSPDFERDGATAAEALRGLIAETGEELEALGAVLDFGVGCGRLARHWGSVRGPDFHGCDPNAEAVAWCRDNLPFLSVVRSGAEPPLAYGDETFDLIYAYSVFTHLSEPLQHRWMAELRRVLRPGGRLIFSTHGERQRPLMEPAVREQFDRGEFAVRFPENAGMNLCSAFHPPTWVRERLVSGFELVAERPGGVPGLGDQDVYVVRVAR